MARVLAAAFTIIGLSGLIASPGFARSMLETEPQLDAIVAQMTLEEKVRLLGGNHFETFAIPRLGIPAMKMTDGPLGVRLDRATAFPAGLAMGATFDPDLIERVAAAIADETRAQGRHVLLGPCVNISRQPFGGRNFESFGEDPFLTGALAARYVRGIQSRNIAASVKHFVANDQEFERGTIDVKVDLRALFELHLPAFKAAVDAGSWTVMSAYNKINGHHASENDFLQNKILKDLWGFQGLVVSDWGATHSTIAAANHGLDLEMPTGEYFDRKLIDAVAFGAVPLATIDDKVRRILRVMFAIGLLGEDKTPALPAPLGPASPEHQRLAYRAAVESTVLLKNENRLLPLGSAQRPLKRLAVIGPNADVLRSGGGGSSAVQPFAPVTPLEGLRRRLGKRVDIRYAQGVALKGDLNRIQPEHLRPSRESKHGGLRAEYFANPKLEGAPFLTRIEERVHYWADEISDPKLKTNVSIRWSGDVFVASEGNYRLTIVSEDGVRVALDGKEIISNWSEHKSTTDEATVTLGKGWHPIRIEYFNGEGQGWLKMGWSGPFGDDLVGLAVAEARKADAAIVFAGLGNDIETEGVDRDSMDLPAGQAELIRRVADANPNTIVVLTSGNPVAMGEWLGQVKSLLHVWYPGQAGGLAIADLIIGRANPSAKLPVTFLKRWEDSAAYGNYPGRNGVVEYKEGIFVGYRHHDRHGIEPNFPFGYGLSYTQFEISGLEVKMLDDSASSPRARVSFTVRNRGRRSGAEVAQIYVGEDETTVERPVRELKGFAKVRLRAGEAKRVTIDLDRSAFSYFDEAAFAFKANRGRYTLSVGNSSRDLPHRSTVTLR